MTDLPPPPSNPNNGQGFGPPPAYDANDPAFAYKAAKQPMGKGLKYSLFGCGGFLLLAFIGCTAVGGLATNFANFEQDEYFQIQQDISLENQTCELTQDGLISATVSATNTGQVSRRFFIDNEFTFAEAISEQEQGSYSHSRTGPHELAPGEEKTLDVETPDLMPTNAPNKVRCDHWPNPVN